MTLSLLFRRPTNERACPVTAYWQWADNLSALFLPIAEAHIRDFGGRRVTLTETVIPALALQPHLDGLQAGPSLALAKVLAEMLQSRGFFAWDQAERPSMASRYQRHTVVVEATPRGCFRLAMLCTDARERAYADARYNRAPDGLLVPLAGRVAAAEAALQLAQDFGATPDRVAQQRTVVCALGLTVQP